MSAGQTAMRLSEGSLLCGEVRGGDLTLLGQFEGELALEGHLLIGRQARVKATVRAEVVEVDGVFEGEIRAQTIVFAETACARGVFRSDRLGIREGACVDGAFGDDASDAIHVVREDPLGRANEAGDGLPILSEPVAGPAAGAPGDTAP